VLKIVLCLLPVVGLVVALCVASHLRGSARRIAYAVGPLLVGCAMYWAGGEIARRPGGYLTDLAVDIVYVCGYVILATYYAVFLFLAMAGWRRRNAQVRKAATPSTAPAAPLSTASPATPAHQPGGARTSRQRQPT